MIADDKQKKTGNYFPNMGSEHSVVINLPVKGTCLADSHFNREYDIDV